MNVLNRGCLAWRKALATNTTDTSFDSKVPTTTEPTGEGVFDVESGSVVGQGLQAVFYGEGANDTTFSVRLIGWKLMTTLWVPVVLAEFACTLSTVVGVAAAAVTDNDRFADTITLASGFSTANVIVTSSTGNIVGHATINLDGYGKIEWSFDMTGATNGNALWAMY